MYEHYEPDEPDELTDLIGRLEQAAASTCEDRRHAAALAGAAGAIRQLSDLHDTITASLDSLPDPGTAPMDTPTPCTDAGHVRLLNEAASGLTYALHGIPDLLRTLAAQTPEQIDELRHERRELSKIMRNLDDRARMQFMRSLV
jgi:hypothetical protein